MSVTTYIAKNGQNLGGFDVAGITEGLRTGYFTPDDQAWREGMTEWVRLADVVSAPDPHIVPVKQVSPKKTAPIATATVPRMATEKQIAYIADLGGTPDMDMTIEQASAMITRLQADPVAQEIRMNRMIAADREREKHQSLYLHQELAKAKAEQAACTGDKYDKQEAREYVHDAEVERVGFWQGLYTDEAYEGEETSTLYDQFGRFYSKPSAKQVKDVLSQLDVSGMWEEQNAGMFFGTLGELFPALHR